MFSKNIGTALMILVVSGFVSNSFAWRTYKGYTSCRGNTCHHTTVKKGCVNGHCGKVRYGSTWHR